MVQKCNTDDQRRSSLAGGRRNTTIPELETISEPYITEEAASDSDDSEKWNKMESNTFIQSNVISLKRQSCKAVVETSQPLLELIETQKNQPGGTT